MESHQSSCSDGLVSVPQHFRVRVIYDDHMVIIINKPPNLRSVPGHAVSFIKRGLREKDKSATLSGGASTPTRQTGQEAWMEAIRSFATQKCMDEIDEYLARLGASERYLTSIPRKYKTFCRYLLRNRHRIFENDDISSSEIQENLATSMVVRIEELQRPLLGLPDPTSHEESTMGQRRLLGYADREESRSNQQLVVVHRLDCETSSVMVFARQAPCASI
jgi:hypothetical protein